MADYVSRTDRFQQGDFPMVCVRSGEPADALVLVTAHRTSAWRWFVLPASIVWFAVAGRLGRRVGLEGSLPFRTGEEAHVGRRGGVRLTYDRLIGVVIHGAHPDFVAACEAAVSPGPESRA